eukprot:2224502-Amphidinium_carterae.3
MSNTWHSQTLQRLMVASLEVIQFQENEISWMNEPVQSLQSTKIENSLDGWFKEPLQFCIVGIMDCRFKVTVAVPRSFVLFAVGRHWVTINMLHVPAACRKHPDSYLLLTCQALWQVLYACEQERNNIDKDGCACTMLSICCVEDLKQGIEDFRVKFPFLRAFATEAFC